MIVHILARRGDIVEAVLPDGRVVRARVCGPWVEVVG